MSSGEMKNSVMILAISTEDSEETTVLKKKQSEQETRYQYD